MFSIIHRASIAALACLLTGFASARPSHLITENSVGKIKLGMTVAEVRRSIAPMTLSRSADGKGVALIAVNQGKNELLRLYAGEDDPSQEINEEAKIQIIEVWSDRFKTQNGIHVGMLLKDVHQYGKLKEIMLSEIESREYATFEHQPKNMWLRLQANHGNTPAGIYRQGENTTTTYTPGAMIFSISIDKR